MQTDDTSNLFQSDAQHAKRAYREAKAALHADTGNPITLASRPLRVTVRHPVGKEAEAWCAESGFVVQRVGLETGTTKQIYRGHMGPVTSLDFYKVTSDSSTSKGAREVMLSGSWDKSFRVWDTQTKTHLSTTLAHTDFVKALIVIPSLSIVVTGSSDRDIRVWDLSPLSSLDIPGLVASSKDTPEPAVEESAPPPAVTETGAPLRTGAAPPSARASNPLPLLFSLKAHTRPIERLGYFDILDSSPTDNDEGDAPERRASGKVVLVSVDSMGAMKTWEIGRDGDGKIAGKLRTETRPHEIAIYDLVIGDGEIWTASADNSVLLSTFDASSPSLAPAPRLRIPHPNHVKSLLSLPLSLPTLNSSHIITGSSDEALRIFDLNALDESPSASAVPWTGTPTLPDASLEGLVIRVEGHSHDIVDLGVYTQEVEGKREAWVVSASVDGTLRRWRWPDVLQPPKVKKELVEVVEEKESLLTEEEERELAELMEED